jgi:hypothetical protein
MMAEEHREFLKGAIENSAKTYGEIRHFKTYRVNHIDEIIDMYEQGLLFDFE